MNQEVGNRRLLKLAAYLKTIPRERFDYRYWVGENWGGKPDLSCGTTACALGWATTIPTFRRLGLRLVSIDRFIVDVEFNGGESYGSIAAQKLFYLDTDEVSHLFFPGNDRYGRFSYSLEARDLMATPKQVARKIERFVARRRKAATK